MKLPHFLYTVAIFDTCVSCLIHVYHVDVLVLFVPGPWLLQREVWGSAGVGAGDV